MICPFLLFLEAEPLNTSFGHFCHSFCLSVMSSLACEDDIRVFSQTKLEIGTVRKKDKIGAKSGHFQREYIILYFRTQFNGTTRNLSTVFGIGEDTGKPQQESASLHMYFHHLYPCFVLPIPKVVSSQMFPNVGPCTLPQSSSSQYHIRPT